MTLRFSVTGLKEIDACLRGLPLQVSDKVLAQAHADAAFPLVAKAHLLAPVGKTGNLADSIGVVKVGIKRGGNIGLVQVGPRRGGGYKGFHGHFIEFVKTNRDGSRSEAKPFVEPAFQATKNEVEANISMNIGRRLFNYMKRTLRG